MLHNTADCQADAERFIKRIVDSETVWYLENKDRTAYCESNHYEDEDGESVTVLIFFSDKAYARRVQQQHFSDFDITSMHLFNFLYQWLPGMTGDGVLAGPNWTGDLAGIEMEAFPLRDKIEDAMTEDHLARYERKYEDITREG